MRFGIRTGSTALVGLFFALGLGVLGTAAVADNQTPTVTPVSTDASSLPYKIKLVRQKKTAKTLPNLQGFADGHIDGLWVIIGGRSNGLHNFTDSGLKNFPPRKQNDRIWVIDPATGNRWSRSLSKSSLSQDQIDALSSTAMESVQVGNTLYVIGGYGYKRSVSNFVTYDSLTAFDLRDIVLWVRSPGKLPAGKRDLANLIRQTSHSVLKVTGGQATKLGKRMILAFGQLFDGGYGDPDFNQVYTTQVRSFRLRDTGKKVSISRIRRDPTAPNPTDYRRRDYTLVPFIEMKGKRKVAKATALAGVFTETTGIFTVPVEISRGGVPSMADPSAPSTFKQAMSGYDTAFLPIWDAARKKSHSILFAGISYVYYNRQSKTFVEDSGFPFINDITALVRSRNGGYEQVLIGRFPTVRDADGKRLRFGAEAKVFIHPDIPVTGNGMVDLKALRKTFGVGKRVLVGYLYGGIAADAPNNGNTVASNLIFKIYLTTR
ncbi:hypothetical protein [Microbaculum sp. FT89]|uniref:hypothetical protein n=1 Tax=Microbaculum sp. FT89 TaxID=3447298 RepID=UPI003F53D82F